MCTDCYCTQLVVKVQFEVVWSVPFLAAWVQSSFLRVDSEFTFLHIDGLMLQSTGHLITAGDGLLNVLDIAPASESLPLGLKL